VTKTACVVYGHLVAGNDAAGSRHGPWREARERQLGALRIGNGDSPAPVDGDVAWNSAGGEHADDRKVSFVVNDESVVVRCHEEQRTVGGRRRGDAQMRRAESALVSDGQQRPSATARNRDFVRVAVEQSPRP
jgi:hypothetical protein